MRRACSALFLIAALAITGCQAADVIEDVDPAIGVNHVGMVDNAFDPPVVEIPAGSTVTWAFSDNGVSHNVVGDAFESDVQSDGTFEHTFTDPGTYDYECALHPGMQGRVIVTDR